MNLSQSFTNEYLINVNRHFLRVVQGGLWHDSRTKKITNHGSRILKCHFLESRKRVLFYPVLALQIVFEEIKITKIRKKHTLLSFSYSTKKKSKLIKAKERLHTTYRIPPSFSKDDSNHSSTSCSNGPKKHQIV